MSNLIKKFAALHMSVLSMQDSFMHKSTENRTVSPYLKQDASTFNTGSFVVQCYMVEFMLHRLGHQISDVPTSGGAKGIIIHIILRYTGTCLHYRNAIHRPQ